MLRRYGFHSLELIVNLFPIFAQNASSFLLYGMSYKMKSWPLTKELLNVLNLPIRVGLNFFDLSVHSIEAFFDFSAMFLELLLDVIDSGLQLWVEFILKILEQRIETLILNAFWKLFVELGIFDAALLLVFF